jgi:DNA primase
MSEQIAEICRRTSVADYLKGRGVDVVQCGKKMKCRCPLHEEKTPSFYIAQKTGGGEWFSCFGCGRHGDIIDLIMFLEHRLKGDVIRSLAKSTGVELGRYDPSTRIQPSKDEVLAAFCREEAVAVVISSYAGEFLEASGCTQDAVGKLMIVYRKLDDLLAAGDQKGLRNLLVAVKRLVFKRRPQRGVENAELEEKGS